MINIMLALYKVKCMLLVHPGLQWQYEGAKSLLNWSKEMLLRAVSFSRLQGSSQYCIRSLPGCARWHVAHSSWRMPCAGGSTTPRCCSHLSSSSSSASGLSGGRSHIPKVFLEMLSFSFNNESQFYDLLINLIFVFKFIDEINNY